MAEKRKAQIRAVFGDIHAYARDALKAYEEIKPHVPRENRYQGGDMIGRGPNPQSAVDITRHFVPDEHILEGNHEFMLMGGIPILKQWGYSLGNEKGLIGSYTRLLEQWVGIPASQDSAENEKLLARVFKNPYTDKDVLQDLLDEYQRLGSELIGVHGDERTTPTGMAVAAKTTDLIELMDSPEHGPRVQLLRKIKGRMEYLKGIRDGWVDDKQRSYWDFFNSLERVIRFYVFHGDKRIPVTLVHGNPLYTMPKAIQAVPDPRAFQYVIDNKTFQRIADLPAGRPIVYGKLIDDDGKLLRTCSRAESIPKLVKEKKMKAGAYLVAHLHAPFFLHDVVNGEDVIVAGMGSPTKEAERLWEKEEEKTADEKQDTPDGSGSKEKKKSKKCVLIIEEAKPKVRDMFWFHHIE